MKIFRDKCVSEIVQYLFNELATRTSSLQRGYASKGTRAAYTHGWINADESVVPPDFAADRKAFADFTDTGGMVAALGTAACVALTACAAGAATGGAIVGGAMGIANSLAQLSPTSSFWDVAIDGLAGMVPNSWKLLTQTAAEGVKKTETVDNLKKKTDDAFKDYFKN